MIDENKFIFWYYICLGIVSIIYLILLITYIQNPQLHNNIKLEKTLMIGLSFIIIFLGAGVIIFKLIKSLTKHNKFVEVNPLVFGSKLDSVSKIEKMYNLYIKFLENIKERIKTLKPHNDDILSFINNHKNINNITNDYKTKIIHNINDIKSNLDMTYTNNTFNNDFNTFYNNLNLIL